MGLGITSVSVDSAARRRLAPERFLKGARGSVIVPGTRRVLEVKRRKWKDSSSFVRSTRSTIKRNKDILAAVVSGDGSIQHSDENWEHKKLNLILLPRPRSRKSIGLDHDEARLLSSCTTCNPRTVCGVITIWNTNQGVSDRYERHAAQGFGNFNCWLRILRTSDSAQGNPTISRLKAFGLLVVSCGSRTG